MKVIFFDIDNTLLDFDGYVKWTLQNGFEKFGIIKYEAYMYDVFKTVNDELWRKIETKDISFEELKKIRFNQVFDALGVSGDGIAFEKYFRDELRESTIIIDGAGKMLEELSGKYILCAASNGPYEQQLYRLNKAGMAQYFDFIFISEKVGYSKPAKEFYDKAFEEIRASISENIEPSERIMIGDSITSDIKGGFDYGMKTCLYDHRGEGIRDNMVDFYVKSLTEITDIINSME